MMWFLFCFTFYFGHPLLLSVTFEITEENNTQMTEKGKGQMINNAVPALYLLPLNSMKWSSES